MIAAASLLAAGAVGATLVFLLAGYWRQAEVEPPVGVESVDVGPANQHTKAPVSYQQVPPVGGKHDPVWQNCDFYSEPVRNENAVHSLEHGAVWITYDPDLPRDQIAELRDLVSGQTYLLVSPFPNLPDDAPIVASAWGKQLRLDGADDPNLQRFVVAYRQGPQTPEPGAVCTGGTG